MSTKKRRRSFEEIALPHMDALYGSAFRLTRNARDAEDLVQDAMLRAYRFWDSYEENSNCKAWLFKILTNTFINNYQRTKRSKEILSAAKIEQESTDGVLMHAHALNQQSPEELLLEQSLSEDVEQALADLPPDFRLAIVLFDVEGFSYKEIADIVECPVGTVMSRLYRGRRLLQNQLRAFAKAEGILHEESSKKHLADTINLDSYRQSKNSKQ